jgi:hypothetical protein
MKDKITSFGKTAKIAGLLYLFLTICAYGIMPAPLQITGVEVWIPEPITSLLMNFYFYGYC